jgi:hypothetical protein
MLLVLVQLLATKQNTLHFPLHGLGFQLRDQYLIEKHWHNNHVSDTIVCSPF